MATLIASDVTLSVGAYTKTGNLMIGRNQFLQKGRVQIVALSSAIGNNISATISGVPLADDTVIPFTGTTGGMSVKDHVVVDQVIAGGTMELYIRNTTVGGLTIDYAVYFTPM